MIEETPLGGPLALFILYIGYLLLIWRSQDSVRYSHSFTCIQRPKLTHIIEDEGILSIYHSQSHPEEAARAEVPFRWRGFN